MIAAGQDSEKLQQQALVGGMTPLRDAALSRVIAGETTVSRGGAGDGMTGRGMKQTATAGGKSATP